MSDRVLEQLRLALALADTESKEFVLPRPQEATPFGGSGFEGAKVNHLTEPGIGRREDMGGKAEVVFTGTIVAADVFVERFLLRKTVDPFRDADPLFPVTEGSDETEPEDKQLIPDAVGTTSAGRALNDTNFVDFLKGLLIGADEELVIQLRNDSGGAVTGEAVIDYDLGTHEQDAEGTKLP